MMTELVPLKAEKEFTSAELEMFEEKYMPTVQKYAEIVKQKKAFEEQEKKFKAELGKVMDDLGIKSMDCPFVKFTRVAAGKDKTTIDIDSLKDKEPELYDELIEDYPKTVKGKAAYVTFTAK